jgi:hypothetical protein
MAIMLAAATGAPGIIARLAVVLCWLGLSVGPIGHGHQATT